MKISHEIPKQLFPFHNSISDYPYFLSHIENQEYVDFYKRKFKESQFSICDNGCFELGKSIDSDILYKRVLEMKPSHLILPDTLHDMQKTVNDCSMFVNRFHRSLQSSNISYIGVLQGNTFEELHTCLEKYIKLNVSYIAIPFDCINNSDWHNIRYIFFKWLLSTYPGYERLNFHFLGIQNPSELLLYSSELKNRITSIDTSSPIINGWLGNEYGEFGLKGEKPKLKLAEHLDEKLNDNQIELIIKNTKKFRHYAEQ